MFGPHGFEVFANMFDRALRITCAISRGPIGDGVGILNAAGIGGDVNGHLRCDIWAMSDR
eukprot:SAG11_NODE_4934_length_1718_cov_2.140828_3_plen_60_part_00